MSFNEIIDRNNVAPSWARLRSNRLHIDEDLQFDGSLIGVVDPSNMQPGAGNQFLHTNALNEVQWKAIEIDNIPSGPDNSILTSNLGLVSWSNDATLDNLTVTTITGKPVKVSNIDSELSTANYVMTSDGLGSASWTAPTSKNAVTAYYSQRATIDTNSLVAVAIPFSNTVTTMVHITKSAGGVFTVNTTGFYLIKVNTNCTDNNSVIRWIISGTGGTYTASVLSPPFLPNTPINVVQQMTALVNLTAGNTFTVTTVALNQNINSLPAIRANNAGTGVDADCNIQILTFA